MSDEWDDDDFGTFESADATTPIAVESPSIASAETPAWLLAAQQQNAQALQINSADTDSNVSPIKDISDDNLSAVDHQLNVLENSHSTEPAKEASDLLSENNWKAFSSAPEESRTITSIDAGSVKESTTDSGYLGDNTFQDVFDLSSSQQTAALESGDNQSSLFTKLKETETELSKEREIILELQNKLDSAIAIKEQTEKSLEDLQCELTKTTNEAKEHRERRQAEHETEMKRLKEEHDENISQLNSESQKTMKLLTEEYSTLSSQAKTEQKNEYEKNLEEIVEKCLELLRQQHSVLSEKLHEDRSLQNKEILDTVQECKTELRDFVEKECTTTTELCSKTKGEMESFLKEEIGREFEKQRGIDSKCKREAMEELTKHFKMQMEESLRLEREKQSDATKLAVEDARRLLLRHIEQDRKDARMTQDRHLMALRMLLTSSQEHLRHLVEDIPSDLYRKEAEE